MILAVIDTNVLVSSLISPAGNEAHILLAIKTGVIIPCWSNDMYAEYVDVLNRPKFSFPAEWINNLLSILKDKGKVFQPQEFTTILPDAKDSKFLYCAEAAKVEFIITGNKRHFPDALCGAIQVVSAGELLNRIAVELANPLSIQ